MGVEAELAEDGVEEAPPFAVVGLVDVEHHRNMRTDVHGLDHRGGSRLKGDAAGGGAGRVRGAVWGNGLQR